MIPPDIRALILDMDGVLWKDDCPIGDLPRIFQRIHDRGLKISFATNNGTLTPVGYAERLTRFGIPAETCQVVTSSLVAAEMVAEALPVPYNPPSSPQYARGEGARSGGLARAVFAIGGDGLLQALRLKGIEPLPVERAGEALAVVMGFDRAITFEKMAVASLLVRRGVPFFATNPDKTFPTPRGEIPGAGAWVSVIVTATGVEPVFAGKPAPHMFELARKRLGTPKCKTLVVGDRLETDIAGAQADEMPTALVLSGVSTREQAEAWKPKVDIIAKDLGELVG